MQIFCAKSAAFCTNRINGYIIFLYTGFKQVFPNRCTPNCKCFTKLNSNSDTPYPPENVPYTHSEVIYYTNFNVLESSA